MSTTTLWNVFNASTGVNLGNYPGEGPDEALNDLARGRGYKNWREYCARVLCYRPDVFRVARADEPCCSCGSRVAAPGSPLCEGCKAAREAA